VKFKFYLPTGFINKAVEKIDITTLDKEGKADTSQFL
jgi:hypothetical protein